MCLEMSLSSYINSIMLGAHGPIQFKDLSHLALENTSLSSEIFPNTYCLLHSPVLSFCSLFLDSYQRITEALGLSF